MDIGESIAVEIATDIAEQCPFKTADPPSVTEEPENIAKDDLPSVAGVQRNSGGTLGKNLTNASNGAAGTVNDLFPAAAPSAQPARDTKRDNGGRVKVAGDTADYPFTVAAHHLIPGEASLARSRLYQKYMTKGGTIKTRSGKSFTVKEHIGYNVNGAHNGMWLPGNYAIRRSTSPRKGVSWGKLPPEFDNWCFEYMRACCAKLSRQFHDSHPTYSTKVLGVLNRMHREFLLHQDVCKECEGKTEVAPPYMVKAKLYNLSTYLAGRLRAVPTEKWKVPWYTSERFHIEMIKAGMLER